MRRYLVLMVAIMLSVPSLAQMSIKDGMVQISERYGINFVYDTSLPVNVPCHSAYFDKGDLEGCLDALFKDSGIAWERHRKFVILTVAKTEESPISPIEHYEISFQMDTITAAKITGVIDRNINFTQTGLTKIDGAAFRRGFAVLSSPDVLKTLQALPGVASGTEMLSNLYVHGGDGSDNLFLLDGVPLYQICHLGGIFSAFNTDVIDNLDFYKSGFPARYGGRTSSVVDITTRDGDFEEYKGLFSIGLLDGRIQFEGPIIKDKTSFNIAIRRSWADAIMYPICQIRDNKRSYGRNNMTNSNLLGYSFTDFNTSVTHKFSEDDRISAHFYIGNDGFKNTDHVSSASDVALMSSQTETDMSWGNILVSLNWQKEFSSRWSMRVVSYWSASRSRVDYDDVYDYWGNPVDEQGASAGTEKNSVMLSHSVLDDNGLTADFDWKPSTSHHVRLGGSFIHHSFRPDYGYGESYYVSDKPIYDVFLRDSVRANGHEASIYVEDEMSLTRWLRANMGLRNTVYSSDGNVWNSLEPRLALKVQLAPNVSVKTSYAEMSQFAHQVATTYLDLPTNCWLPSGQLVSPMRSRQVAAGIYSKFPHNLHLNIEGWYKTMDNLVEYNGMNSLFVRLDEWEQSFKVGRGRSYGLEVDGGYETPSLSLNAFYTLSWNERFFEDFWQDWYPDRNDNRHKLTFQANWRINGKYELYSAWNYHSGNRMTVPTQVLPQVYTNDVWLIDNEQTIPISKWLYEEPNNLKLPDYHRLDIGMNIHRKTRHGREAVWNISVYNVYCRINPIYATFSYDSTKPEEVKLEGVSHGFIPIIPTFSYTLRF